MLEKTPAPVELSQPADPDFSPAGLSPRTQAKVLTFANQKGGTGKTTIAQNLAICLALHYGQRVLCVDLDPQGNLSQGLSAESVRAARTADRLMLVPSARISEYIIPIRPSVDLIPNRYQQELSTAVERLPLYGNPLRKHLSGVMTEYDYILIDTPAGLFRATQIGVDAADQVMIVISSGSYALKGASALVSWMAEIHARLGKQLPLVRIVLNNYDERRRFDRELRQEVRDIFGNDLYETQIRTSVKIVEAAARAQAVVELPQTNPGTTDFKRLSREILGLPINVGTVANVTFAADTQSSDARLKLVS